MSPSPVTTADASYAYDTAAGGDDTASGGDDTSGGGDTDCDLEWYLDGDEDGYLLQIFTKNLVGPIFIELIQRNNHNRPSATTPSRSYQLVQHRHLPLIIVA